MPQSPGERPSGLQALPPLVWSPHGLLSPAHSAPPERPSMPPSILPPQLARPLLAMLSSLLMYGCAYRPSTTQPDLPSPALLNECPEPPPWPSGPRTVRETADDLEHRTALAAECRSRHRLLGDWVRQVLR